MTTQRAARSAGRGKQWSALLASERLAVAFWRKGDVFDGPWVHWGGGCRGVRRRDARASRPQTYRINAPTNAPRQGREVTSPKPAKPRNQAQNHQPDPEQGGVKRSVRGLTGAKAPAFPRRRRRLAWSEAGEVGRAPPAAPSACVLLVGFLGATQTPHVHVQSRYRDGVRGYIFNDGTLVDPTVVVNQRGDRARLLARGWRPERRAPPLRGLRPRAGHRDDRRPDAEWRRPSARARVWPFATSQDRACT